MLYRVISGGQTGADQAGLKAARVVGLETGGWAPKNWRTDDGPNLNLRDIYKLEEHPSFNYPPRTLLNVRDSNGTIIFGDSSSPGSRLTKRLCQDMRRPYLLVPFMAAPEAAKLILDWFTGEIKVLNVAGNRERTQPGIGRWVEEILVDVFSVLLKKPIP